MATIDLTLNGIKIPAIPGYTPPFGTKLATGGLTTQEVNDNIIAPFVKERPVTITETSSTGTVEYNANLVLNGSGLTLTLGSGGYTGCRVEILAKTASSLSFTGAAGSTVDTFVAGQMASYVWSGTAWLRERALGALHTAALSEGFSGSCTYCVVSGIAFVYFNAVSATSAGNSQTVIYNNFPKCKHGNSLRPAQYIHSGGTGYWFRYVAINSNEYEIRADCGGTGALSFSFSYPVADDWVEPAT